MDVSSTSSPSSEEEFVSPLKKLAEEEIKQQQKEVRKRKKHTRKRKYEDASDTESEPDQRRPKSGSRRSPGPRRSSHHTSRSHARNRKHSYSRSDSGSSPQRKYRSPSSTKDVDNAKRARRKRSVSRNFAHPDSPDRSSKRRPHQTFCPSPEFKQTDKHRRTKGHSDKSHRRRSRSRERNRKRSRSRTPEWKSTKWLEKFLTS